MSVEKTVKDGELRASLTMPTNRIIKRRVLYANTVLNLSMSKVAGQPHAQHILLRFLGFIPGMKFCGHMDLCPDGAGYG